MNARALACRGFRWLPGMLDETGARAVAIEGDRLTLATPGGGSAHRTDDGFWKPDLTDAATVWALLPLVGDAWGCFCDLTFSLMRRGDTWSATVTVFEGDLPRSWRGRGNTREAALAEALVGALEAAPKGGAS